MLADRVYRRGLRIGVVAATEHAQTPLPAELRTVIDIGANRGQFALIASRRWPQAHLFCFEPLPAAHPALRRVLGPHPHSELVPAAVGSESARRVLHIARADDSSSLLPITARQTEAFPGTEEQATLDIFTVSLDEHFPTGVELPALLKIDVQGLELEVLRGAERLLTHIDHVLVECSFAEFYLGQPRADEVIRFLHTHGFTLTDAVAPSTDRRGVVQQIDLVFGRTPSADVTSPPAQ